MSRALLSVSDKSGLVEFARGLAQLGWELVSTGGTANTLRAAGLQVMDVSEVTHHPEMMNGRVKTLHPAIHAGLLGRREVHEDVDAMRTHGYQPIDLVAVNLYPFHEAVAANADLPVAMEKVDIGGPSMLRSAAKNHAHVITIIDPADYPRVLDALRGGEVNLGLRRELAAKVFAETARYDAAIASYFQARSGIVSGSGSPNGRLELEFAKVQELRYGENPDQHAAFYRDVDAPAGSLPSMKQLHGKELSFNNLLDIDAAVLAVSAWSNDATAACVIIKHTTPCGVAVAASVEQAYENAVACDPVSAFGGVVAFNQPLNDAAATHMSSTFYEIVIAPSFAADALERLKQKKNLRLIELPIVPSTGTDYKRVNGGLLVQDRMAMTFPEDAWSVVSQRQPTPSELDDLRFAWRVSAAVKSNAIVIARDRRTLGIGAGQMSRVDSSRIAVMKAHDQKADLRGAVLASDAFFPFRDGVDAAAMAGVKAIIQPGGSLRDEEVITAANEHDIAMVFTGRRVFRH
jgi:phosphoribosylaminoimidazolecarboxamide formyltransferase / IMP cyclohydrolase